MLQFSKWNAEKMDIRAKASPYLIPSIFTVHTVDMQTTEDTMTVKASSGLEFIQNKQASWSTTFPCTLMA